MVADYPSMISLVLNLIMLLTTLGVVMIVVKFSNNNNTFKVLQVNYDNSSLMRIQMKLFKGQAMSLPAFLLVGWFIFLLFFTSFLPTNVVFCLMHMKNLILYIQNSILFFLYSKQALILAWLLGRRINLDSIKVSSKSLPFLSSI
jgi:hypothetical protein